MRKKRILKINKKNNSVVKIFDSISEISELKKPEYAVWVRMCCVGKANYYDSHIWMYEENIGKELVFLKTRIINERKQLDNILNGKDINVMNIRYLCSLVARDCISTNMGVDDIYNKIIQWGKLNGLNIKLPIKKLIYENIENFTSIKNVDKVFVSEFEVDYVFKKFNKKNTRKLAMALLVYFKVFSNKEKECKVNIRIISEWCGLNYCVMNNIYARTLKEIIDSGMFEDVEEVHKYTNRITKFHRVLRLNFDFSGSDKFYIKDDSFEQFFSFVSKNR